ncbi:AAA family ATPase, partial [Bacillus thuringiensis]|nr:AAA family ATPase [Bacillus thuringiensis]
SHVQGQTLSGGLQWLTSFAMSIVAPPPILLLDEPTNNVDPIRRKIIWNSLRKLAQKGHIVIVVTHNLLEVDQYADRYLLFDKGTLIKDA